MNTFGENLRKLRKEKGLTVRKLSELSGVAHSYLSQVETGKRGVPKVETLEKIAAGLNIPSIDLLVQAGYINPDDYITMKNEKDNIEWSIEEQSQQPFQIDFLLDSSHPLLYQDRLLTKEEKSKIKSLIEIVLKD
ncbi:helix-turn-helix domain-containing protein [Evansella sp. AB-rgal1]|uniref:helix-turn-helix domain-containing protein n=1 Tax=Evansella sp. AB-rgal1 TaxID=3242696 RepID=UPI00359CD82D